jgi:tetratricopeptide (TPR) repeat protein
MIALSSYHPHLSLRSISFLLIALCSIVGVTWAQAPEPQVVSSQIRIAQDLAMIHTAEEQHRSAADLGAKWSELASEYHYAADFPKAEDAYNQSLHLLKSVPEAREAYVTTLEDLAALYLNYGRIDEAESVRKQALAVRKKLGNPQEIGISHAHLADIALARHQYKKAERLDLQAVAEMQSFINPPRVGLLSALITITYARCAQGNCNEGLTSAQQGLAFAYKRFDRESAAVGFALETLGYAQWQTGSFREGEQTMLQGLGILRTTLVPADPRLNGALLQYEKFLSATNRRVEAQQVHSEVERTTKEAGVACPSCTISVYSLSKTLR